MYTLSNGLLPEVINELCVKIIKYTIIQLEIVINIIFKLVLAFFKWECSHLEGITTNIDVNISFMQFKIVLKLYLHENEVILKYTK